MKDYETVFILNPVLSDQQIKDAVAKFENLLKDSNADIVNFEPWGLRKLAYPINHKTTGHYTLIEFRSEPEVVDKLETEYRRDESVLRFLTTSLDKHALEYNAKRRKGEFNKKKEEPKEEGKK